MKIKIDHIAYHRNGVAGDGFYLVSFSFREPGESRKNMLATVFEERGMAAVIDMDDLASRFRGENFEPLLRDAIKDHWKKEDARLSVAEASR